MKNKEKQNLVSVTIPTYNSERTIKKCIESVKSQTYNNIEIVLIDSHSKDKTCEIAEKLGAKIYQYDGTLLGARALGVEKSKGDFILLLDSDQILENTTIEKGAELLKDYDMLWLQEKTYNPKSILEKLYDADRILVQRYAKDFINPIGGVILPRFYKKEILVKAFNNIPKKILPLCVAHDHAIIYYEANRISKKIGQIGDEKHPTVWHIEPSNFIKLFKKTYRYGKTTRELVKNGGYLNIIKSKNKMRKSKRQDLGLSIKSNILRILRGIPYKLGYWFG